MFDSQLSNKGHSHRRGSPLTNEQVVLTHWKDVKIAVTSSFFVLRYLDLLTFYKFFRFSWTITIVVLCIQPKGVEIVYGWKVYLICNMHNVFNGKKN